MADCLFLNTFFKFWQRPHPRPTQMTASTVCTSTTHASTSDSNKYTKHSDQNANDTESPGTPDSRRFSNEDIQAIKTRLMVLQDMLVESPELAPELTLGDSRVEQLSHENERLRRQLQDRDRLIETLREQLAKVGGER
uniref:BMERB domain-containing protein n=1 Tax=Panagrellus redivivus TaxID=6233 RepID=A0A7E4VTY7_PANRE